VAGAAGLGLALGAAFLIEYLDTSLRWEGTGVQSILDLPVIGAVPQVSKKRVLPLPSSNPSSPVAGSMRALRTNVFLMRPDHPFKTLLLTSPRPLEGKSFTLANLAAVLASTGNRVIVVDADMRRPTLHEFFDRPNVTGLADVLSDGDARDVDCLSVPLQETDFDNLYLLSAGRPPVDPATLLTSPRFPILLQSLEKRGDVILLDSAPVLGPPDATVLATLVEGTILVVSVGFTRRAWVQQAKDRLLVHGEVNLLGIAINRAKMDDSMCYDSSDEAAKELRRGVADDDAPWLTLSEAAAYLGISKALARRWCAEGRLTTRRSGLRRRVSRDDVERMVMVESNGGVLSSGVEAEQLEI
jgi:succinoglycan biosynthesis transport protein ExoP